MPETKANTKIQNTYNKANNDKSVIQNAKALDDQWEGENTPTKVTDAASGRDYNVYKNKLGEVINVSGTGGYKGSTGKAGEQVWWSGKDAVKMSKALARNADEATRAAAERTFKSKNPKARIDYIKYANAATDAQKKSEGRKYN